MRDRFGYGDWGEYWWETDDSFDVDELEFELWKDTYDYIDSFPVKEKKQ